MKKNIFKKFIVLFSLSFILFGFNSALATDTPVPVPINLKVYSGSTVLFNGPLTVTACAESLAVGAPVTVNGKCAVEQSGLSNTWTWNYAPSGWLDQLGGYTTTPDFSKSWGWFNNLNYGNVALNQHVLSSGEELLLTYNSFPLRISASKNEGTVGDTITFTAEEKSTFNGDYSDMLWTKSLDTTITLGTKSCVTIADGTCSIVLDTAGSINAIGNKTLYVPSNNLSIEVSKPVSHSSGGSYIIKQLIPEKIIEKTFSVEKALNFLETKENSDGSYSALMYTDWVAIGAVAGGDSNLKSSLINYFKTNSFDSYLLTDNERHAMALMALGIDPYNGTGVNYIKKITDSFDGTQFGDKNEDNDDIFALIVLKNAGYNEQDEIIMKDVNYLVSKQASDGSYGSVDMTGASLQALEDFKDLKGVSEAISKGEEYLISKQGKDGDFGNSFSTSWVLQAMPHNEQILKAESYLASKQEIDGGMENTETDINTRIWATSYAIPAILHKPWNEILNNFPKQEAEVSSISPRQGLGENKINKGIIKKSAKTLEDRVKIENLIEDNNLPQNNKIQSKASRVWGMFKAPFNWLLDKLSF